MSTANQATIQEAADYIRAKSGIRPEISLYSGIGSRYSYRFNSGWN